MPSSFESPLRLFWAISLFAALPVRAGKLDEKGRAFALCARKAYASAVGFDDVARYSQSEAGASYTASGGIASEEFRKDLWLLAGRDAYPLVANLHADRSVLGLGRDLDDPALRGVLDRIRDQVPDHLAKPVRVSHHRKRLRAHFDRELVLRALLAVELRLLAEQGDHVHQLLRALEAALLDAAHVEEVVDQFGEPAGLGIDDPEVVAPRLRVEVARQEELCEAEHARERG